MKYLRYRNLYDNYYYSGVVDHLPEWTVLFHNSLTINAVYRFMGMKDGKIELSTQMQQQEMDHPLPKKGGNLVTELLKPFDSNGKDVKSVFVNPLSVTQWLPSFGDEVFYDGQYHVIVKTPYDDPFMCKDRTRDIVLLAKAEKNLSNLRHYFSHQTHKLHLYPTGCKPMYGEGHGTWNPFMKLDELPSIDWGETTNLIPVLGRSRADIYLNPEEKTVSAYRHHTGYRGMIRVTCIDDTDSVKGRDYNSSLVKGRDYTLNMIDYYHKENNKGNVVIILGDEDVVAKASRFKFPKRETIQECGPSGPS